MQNLCFGEKIFSPFTVSVEAIQCHVFFSGERHWVVKPEIRNIFGLPRMFGITTMEIFQDENILSMRIYGTNSSHGPKKKKQNRNIAPNVVRAGSFFFSSEACLLTAELLARFRLFPAFLLPNHWPEQTMCSFFLLIIKIVYPVLPFRDTDISPWQFFGYPYRCIVRRCISFERIIEGGVAMGWELIRAFHLIFVLMDGTNYH